jgi:hypothetical protein
VYNNIFLVFITFSPFSSIVFFSFGRLKSNPSTSPKLESLKRISNPMTNDTHPFQDSQQGSVGDVSISQLRLPCDDLQTLQLDNIIDTRILLVTLQRSCSPCRFVFSNELGRYLVKPRLDALELMKSGFCVAETTADETVESLMDPTLGDAVG